LQVFSETWGKSVKVRYLYTGECLRTLHGRGYHIGCVAISHDDSMVISGSDSNSTKVWDKQFDQHLRTFKAR